MALVDDEYQVLVYNSAGQRLLSQKFRYFVALDYGRRFSARLPGGTTVIVGLSDFRVVAVFQEGTPSTDTGRAVTLIRERAEHEARYGVTYDDPTV